MGDELPAEWVPMSSLVYEPRSDAPQISLERLNHMFNHPRTVFVEENQLELLSISVIDASKNQIHRSSAGSNGITE